ncbi:LamG-like jellyroll fold domain-containing protein [Cryobacterium sp. Hh38]|uniref:LamG-like jellyroll fold domain-containing protein n=1 Tax=Cryobacterium sp. Hh38 TaxID=1259156 RepID=UPI001F53E422|nr:LamG-like jellyroll fold domain-containing protein [Cryobacterium sp. Hh38]
MGSLYASRLNLAGLISVRKRPARAGVFGLLTAVAVVAAVLTVPLQAVADTAPTDPATPVTMAADSLPTAQINGVVWTQLIVGTTVYVGGEFTRARPAGSGVGVNEVVRTNLLAYNLTTGVLIPTFSPNPNGAVRALVASADGSRIYAGGSFTSVSGANRYRLAAFDTGTGALVASFAPVLNAQVKALGFSGGTLFAGGVFSTAGGQPRPQIASFDASNGALKAWSGTPSGGAVNALTVSPDGAKVIIGGAFTSYNGASTPGYGMAALDAVTGASLPWAVNSLLRNGGINGGITSLTSSSDGVFGTGYDYGAGANFEGTFRASWSDGSIIWMEDCHGDTYSAAPTQNVVYTTGHAHYCGNIGGPVETAPRSYHRTLSFTMATTGLITPNAVGSYDNFVGKPRPSLLSFYPDINTGVYTGQGQGPWNVVTNGQYLLYAGEFTNVNNKGQQGLARFASSTTATNKEGPRLANAAFVASAFVPDLQSLSTGTVRIGWKSAYDRDNERLKYEVLRDGVSVGTVLGLSVDWSRPSMGWTDSGLSPGQAYSYQIRVSDPFGNVKTGSPASVNVASAGIYSAYASAVRADSPTSYWPLGEAGGTTAFDWAAAANAQTNSGVTRGVAGALSGDDGSASRFSGTTAGFATSSAFETPRGDFSVESWVKTTTKRGGKIIGLGNSATANSAAYDRHVYMDNTGRIWFGVKPGALRTVNTTGSYNDGQWHHIVATVGANGMSLYIDGALAAQRTDTTSAAPIQGYWRIGGDNLSGWTSRPLSDYIAADIDEVAVYPAALGAASIANHYAVGSSGPQANVQPTAAFSYQTSPLAVSVDASASTDADGTVAGYAWSWGDGTNSTGKTATHSYTVDGSYPVSLTVADDSGATAVTTQNVLVPAVDPKLPVAIDAFSRVLSSGLGTAASGGAWTTTGSSGNSSVSEGVGRFKAAAGTTVNGYLSGVSVADSDVSVTIALQQAATGSGAYSSVIGRRVGTDDYRARVKFLPTGVVQLQLMHGATTLTVQNIAGLTYTTGTQLRVRLQVFGTGPTTIRAKVWSVGGTEPSAWQLSTTDATPAMQASGSVGLALYLGSTATVTPVTTAFDDFVALRVN